MECEKAKEFDLFSLARQAPAFTDALFARCDAEKEG